MIKENRVSKYMLYAIGEIVLVVIGILIALQINTWSAEARNRKQGLIYLTDLRSDLTSDVNTLNVRIRLNLGKLNAIDSIVKILDAGPAMSEIEKERFFAYNQKLLSESYFIPEKGTITQIGSTGTGNLIPNKELRDLVFRYYSTSEGNEQNMEKSLQLYQHNFLTDRIVQASMLGAEALQQNFGTTLDRPALDLNALKQNSGYIMTLVGKKGLTLTQNGTYASLLNSAEELLRSIQAELDKPQ